MLYGFISAPPCLSQLPQRSTVSQDLALSRALGPGDVHPAPMFFHLSPSKSSWVPPGPPGPIRVPPGPTRVPPGPTRVHPGPIFLGPTPRLGSKNLIHLRCSPDHFPNGVCNCLWHGSPLSARRTQDCMDSSQRATVGTTASCRSHRNVTDTGRLQATRTSRDYRDTKSCRCFSTRGGRGGGWGWRQASARLAPE